MIDHVIGRPSVKSRRLQVLAVLSFWSAYLYRGPRHGPPVARDLSRFFGKKLTAWQVVVLTMLYLYGSRHLSTLVGLASPEPMANMYSAAFFRATWVLTAMDAGFWTAMKIKRKWLRDIASMVFTIYYLIAAERADEKVRKVRGNLTVEHLRVSWNKGTTPYLTFFSKLLSPRFTRWPPRLIRIPRPATSDYKTPVEAWLYFDGPLSELTNHTRLVLDVPGGGFVAMNPRCNDDKLLAWAAKTELPILSLDYKKAPEHPYPYALNECYDVYTTLINSRGRCVGMSGHEVPKVVVTGDSAGGNLATAMTLMILESGMLPMRRLQGQSGLPAPDGLVLFYPGLDMNIGNWMSEEQMSLIRDRGMRNTNKKIARRKSMQYNDLVGTPHHSDDEDESPPKSMVNSEQVDKPTTNGQSDPSEARSPHPEYAHVPPTTWKHGTPASPNALRTTASHRPQPLSTRLAMSSMLSYFNDRVLTPEMMRAMIILYIGPHNRPDFSQDYLLSPILAPDMLLARFPKTYFLTGERDPLVDDTVIFAGRLRRVKAAAHASGGERLHHVAADLAADGFDERDHAEVVLIPGTSHGFLQFPALYPPAWHLIDRSAGWIEDAFAAAEVAREGRREGRRRAAARVNGAGKHHVRTESSGDEDWPLEIGMTRARGRVLNGDKGGGVEKSRQESIAEEDAEAAADEADGKVTKKGKKKAVGARSKEDKSLVKLNSSDDLLGRRMQGFVGGLTGIDDDD